MMAAVQVTPSNSMTYQETATTTSMVGGMEGSEWLTKLGTGALSECDLDCLVSSIEQVR